LKQLIEQCWHADPNVRPSFVEIEEAIRKMYTKDFLSSKERNPGSNIRETEESKTHVSDTVPYLDDLPDDEELMVLFMKSEPHSTEVDGDSDPESSSESEDTEYDDMSQKDRSSTIVYADSGAPDADPFASQK
jgi:hypothetical protein